MSAGQHSPAGEHHGPPRFILQRLMIGNVTPESYAAGRAALQPVAVSR